MRTVDTIPVEEWEQIVERFIQQEAQDESLDELPTEQFFGAWAEIESAPSYPTLELEIQVEVLRDRIRLMLPAATDLTVRGNRLRLPDGRELIFELAPPSRLAA